MNLVIISGNLTNDPEVRYTQGMEPQAVATFNVAVDRPVRQGAAKQTDFPRCTAFGKQAENCERYLKKGRKVLIRGRIQTGSYTNKDGATIYTTDVIADSVEFMDKAPQQQGYAQQSYQQPAPQQGYAQPQPAQQQAYAAPQAQAQPQQQVPSQETFEALDEDVPF